MSRSGLQVVHLTASPFFGGPERQMIGLACAMASPVNTTFLCLMENGKAAPFANELRKRGKTAIELKANHPHLVAAAKEAAHHLRELNADVLLAHGYKANFVGLLAACMAHIPIIMVSRGWTGHTRKVRFNEMIDRFVLRFADRVVCVSEGHAALVRRAVPDSQITVICNAIDTSRFARVDPDAGKLLRSMLPEPVMHIVLAAGRLSPEKGFHELIEAAITVAAHRDDVGFVLVGDGPMRRSLLRQVERAGLRNRFVLAGFRNDVDQLMPHASLFVQASHAEGMPNVILESMAASLPVVATTAGGTGELVVHGETGYLIAPGDTRAMAEYMLSLLGDSVERATMGSAARRRVEEQFTFATQAAGYERLLSGTLTPHASRVAEPVDLVARA